MDTGPLVSYLDAGEALHGWAVQQFALLNTPSVTCEAVITEACFLVSSSQDALQKIAEYLADGVIELDFALSSNHVRVFSLMLRYRNVPMSLADACLVCMAEDHRGSCILTLDSDFSIYRLGGRTPASLISPENFD